MKRSLTPVLTATAALVATLAVAATLLALGGYSPGAVFAALFRGAFGTWDRFFSFTLVRATPPAAHWARRAESWAWAGMTSAPTDYGLKRRGKLGLAFRLVNTD